MPKLSSFLSVGTAVKVGAGAAVGYFATVGVSSRTDAPEEPAKAEMREEREKKLNFEV